MSAQSYNTIELRYADSELSQHRFVKEVDLIKAGKFSAVMAQKLTDAMYEIGGLKDEIEILRAERSHWHHMYNNSMDERPDI